MLTALQQTGRALLARIEGAFNAAFGAAWNPFYYLGALTIFFFWVVLVSGIYVLVFFETSVFGAYASVEYMTHDQWYLAGVMRSLHRYASDAAIITLMLHMIKEFVMDRYRGSRWFSWFTGVPLLWMIFPLGISGYWLVWDELAQYIAIGTSELLDRLPIFTDPMARNFMLPENLSDRFFTLMAFIHLIGLPIFLVFGIWFHLLRVSSPKVNPPQRLALGSLGAMLVLSFIKPAISHPEADLSRVPTQLNIDWFYLPVYPLLDYISTGAMWVLLVGTSTFICILPWLPPRKQNGAATVSLDNCNGCGRCADDCPYNAIDMLPRSDGLGYSHEAVVDADLCTRCGICAGACPTSTPYRRRTALTPGIDLPGFPIADLRKQTVAAAARLRATPGVLVYACECNRDLDRMEGDGARILRLPCIAMLPPSFIDFALSREMADGVYLMGCREGDCQHRLGVDWMRARLAGTRDPYLRKRIPKERISECWDGAAPWKTRQAGLEKFREGLPPNNDATIVSEVET